jgi:hypothetical protein
MVLPSDDRFTVGRARHGRMRHYGPGERHQQTGEADPAQQSHAPAERETRRSASAFHHDTPRRNDVADG